MPQLYVFLVALMAILVITTRRKMIVEKWQKMEFRKKVASHVEALKKEELELTDTRFKEDHTEEQKNKRFDLAKYKEAMRRAEMAIAKKDWKEAKKILIQALALTKDEIPASIQLAKVYWEAGDVARAENLFTELAEKDPNNPEVHEYLGKIRTQQKRYKEAIGSYVKAVELDEKNDSFFIHLGKLYQLLMRHSLAAECFKRAAELRPRDVDYLFLLAECCGADEDYDNALFTYEKILTIEPYNEKAQENAQKVRVQMKETERVIATLLTEKKKPTLV